MIQEDDIVSLYNFELYQNFENKREQIKTLNAGNRQAGNALRSKPDGHTI